MSSGRAQNEKLALRHFQKWIAREKQKQIVGFRPTKWIMNFFSKYYVFMIIKKSHRFEGVVKLGVLIKSHLLQLLSHTILPLIIKQWASEKTIWTKTYENGEKRLKSVLWDNFMNCHFYIYVTHKLLSFCVVLLMVGWHTLQTVTQILSITSAITSQYYWEIPALNHLQTV